MLVATIMPPPQSDAANMPMHWICAKLLCMGTNQRRSAFLLQARLNEVMKTVEELWLDSLDYSSVFKHLGSYGPLASVSAAAVTVSARGAPDVDAVAAVHAPVLRPGLPPAVDNRFAPLANRTAFVLVNLARVQKDSVALNVTTRSRTAVNFSGRTTERGSAPDERPSEASTAPGTAVPLQDTTGSGSDDPVLNPVPQPSAAPDTSGASPTSTTSGAAGAAAAAQPDAPSEKPNRPNISG